jgi:hypothetical protein
MSHFRKEVVYNILTEFLVPMKLVMLIKMWLNEMYSEVQNGPTQGDPWVAAQLSLLKKVSAPWVSLYPGFMRWFGLQILCL